METKLADLRWMFMYNDLEPINLNIIREFYSNFSSANQQTVFLRGKQIPITEDSLHAFLQINTPPPTKKEDASEKKVAAKNAGVLDLGLVLAIIALPGMRWDSYRPKSDRVDNAILNPEDRVTNDYPFWHVRLGGGTSVVVVESPYASQAVSERLKSVIGVQPKYRVRDSGHSAQEAKGKGAGMAVESAIQPTDQLLNELFRDLLSPDPNALDWTGVGVCDPTTGIERAL
ncbi:hypothetical protein PIB30_060349 [Stylosanthes scabra]|uniref:Uncharacterized protein n=1 Tax=Stylosanthes scabra TaxID=79078 RepID=A0ABU6ZJ80_9FABA|nr:hypothetical protein [Stylosanthes scabra]